MNDSRPDETAINWLLREAERLHEAALDPARWPEVVRAARIRAEIQRARGLSAEQASWLESIVDSATRTCAELARLEMTRTLARSLGDTLPVGIVVVDERGRVVSTNLEARRLLATTGPPSGKGAERLDPKIAALVSRVLSA